MKGYNYSKDYDALYDFICAGNEAICLVDSEHDLDKRDVCKCKKHADYFVTLENGGYRYGGIHFSLKILGSEKDLFIKECTNLNVEWIKPY